MKAVAGFFAGLLVASLAVVATRFRSSQEEERADQITSIALPVVAEPTSEDVHESQLLDLAKKAEDNLVRFQARGVPAYTVRESDSARDRLRRASGCLIAIACFSAWDEVCDAEEYVHIPESIWKYEEFGERVISSNGTTVAWMRCKAEIRPYVKASVRGQALPDMAETVGLMQWEAAARSMASPLLSSFYGSGLFD